MPQDFFSPHAALSRPVVSADWIWGWTSSLLLHCAVAGAYLAASWIAGRLPARPSPPPGHNSIVITASLASAEEQPAPRALRFPENEAGPVTDQSPAGWKQTNLEPAHLPITRHGTLLPADSLPWDTSQPESGQPLDSTPVIRRRPTAGLPAESAEQPDDHPEVPRDVARVPPRVSAVAAVSSRLLRGVEATSLPRKLNCPAPEYPPQAIRLGQQGTVLLQARLDDEGRVAELQLVRSSGVAVLDRAALAAVRRWQFQPAADSWSETVREFQIPVRFYFER